MVRKLLKEKRISFSGLIETKKVSWDRFQIAKFFWGGDNFYWDSVDASDSAGGLMCMWELILWNKLRYLKGGDGYTLKGSIKKILLIVQFVLFMECMIGSRKPKFGKNSRS